jgi:GH15 family glucan-1,4-alpha-glucosidase
MNTAALVGRDGSIDWLCLPRFDSPACFAALLGDEENGRWRIAPAHDGYAAERRYRPHTLILETVFETAGGRAMLIDFMPHTENDQRSEIVRLMRGLEGEVEMTLDLVIRFDYGRTVPWVRRQAHGMSAVAGPNALDLITDAPLEGENFHTQSRFTVRAGECRSFVLAYHRSYHPGYLVANAEALLEETAARWTAWSRRCRLGGRRNRRWYDAVQRSLITLKGLTFQPTGGIVAAATTSLPETPGGERNWDYRFCWIRDATFALYALINAGYHEEARSWRSWLLDAVAGRPDQLQIMYGLAGERWLPEQQLDWLPGYDGSRPVRIGNGAYDQRQIDVFGELMDMLHAARKAELDGGEEVWALQGTLLAYLETLWDQPDEGIWETRGGRRHFTHSRLMAWVAFDRGIKAIEQFGKTGPLDHWKALRARIRAEILEMGFDRKKNSFVQAYGGDTIDAALLMIPLVGFLPADDPRVQGTIQAIERELIADGLVHRYRPEATEDGLGDAREGTFLLCSFWLADCYARLGRRDEAEALFERLLDLRNDLGLLAEEYDPTTKRLLGNFPQAFSHIGLINTAHNLATGHGPAEQRAEDGDERAKQGGTPGSASPPDGD